VRDFSDSGRAGLCMRSASALFQGESMSTIEDKKRVFRLLMLLLGFSIMFLSSCAYDQELTYLNDQVTALNKRVKNLEESRGGDVASMSAEMDNMKTQMQSLSGRAEENEHLIKRALERDLGDQDAMRNKVQELSNRVTVLENTLQKQKESPGAEAPAQGASKPGEAVRGQPATPEAPKNKEIEQYDNALGSYKEGKYEESINAFKSFLKTYPKSDRADNAYFWIGESYMGLKQYEQAILAFQDLIKKYPKGNKAANALLGQAQAFQEIKDKTSAELLYKKIIKNYPGTNEAKTAQKKLETMR
jgi:tol-pal system protein YbgF